MRNYLHQRSKSLLAFAVGLTILSSSFAGEAEAATREEFYYQGSDLATDDGPLPGTTKTKPQHYMRTEVYIVLLNGPMIPLV